MSAAPPYDAPPAPGPLVPAQASGPPPQRAAVPRARSAPRPPAVPRPRAEDVLSSLLAAHVPVSLLLDLADPHGPCSAELLWREPGSADWLHP